MNISHLRFYVGGNEKLAFQLQGMRANINYNVVTAKILFPRFQTSEVKAIGLFFTVQNYELRKLNEYKLRNKIIEVENTQNLDIETLTTELLRTRNNLYYRVNSNSELSVQDFDEGIYQIYIKMLDNTEFFSELLCIDKSGVILVDGILWSDDITDYKLYSDNQSDVVLYQ